MTTGEPGRTHALAFIERELERAQRKVVFWQKRCEMLDEHLRKWHAIHESESKVVDNHGEKDG